MLKTISFGLWEIVALKFILFLSWSELEKKMKIEKKKTDRMDIINSFKPFIRLLH